jgi:hypothetical protein
MRERHESSSGANAMASLLVIHRVKVELERQQNAGAEWCWACKVDTPESGDFCGICDNDRVPF